MPSITLRQLEFAFAVARGGGMTAPAGALSVSQTALQIVRPSSRRRSARRFCFASPVVIALFQDPASLMPAPLLAQ